MYGVCLCEAFVCLFATASRARVPSAIARNPPITLKSRDVFLTTQASSSGRCTCSDQRTGGDSFIFTQGLVSGGCGEGLESKASWLKSCAFCHRSTCFLISACGATYHNRIGILRNNECFEYLGCCLLQSTLGTQPTVLNEFAQCRIDQGSPDCVFCTLQLHYHPELNSIRFLYFGYMRNNKYSPFSPLYIKVLLFLLNAKTSKSLKSVSTHS